VNVTQSSDVRRIRWLVKSVPESHVDPVPSHHSKVSSDFQANDLYSDNNTSTHQQIKSPRNMKHCSICESDGVALRASPKNHERKHDGHETACGQCWEAHLSLQVEEKNRSSEIKCMFCTSKMSADDFKSLAREGTKRR
jgi:hypothetical protein